MQKIRASIGSWHAKIQLQRVVLWRSSRAKIQSNRICGGNRASLQNQAESRAPSEVLANKPPHSVGAVPVVWFTIKSRTPRPGWHSQQWLIPCFLPASHWQARTTLTRIAMVISNYPWLSEQGVQLLSAWCTLGAFFRIRGLLSCFSSQHCSICSL